MRPVAVEALRKGDIVLFADGLNYRAHRLLWIDLAQGTFIACGDAGAVTDGAVDTGKIAGSGRCEGRKLWGTDTCGSAEWKTCAVEIPRPEGSGANRPIFARCSCAA